MRIKHKDLNEQRDISTKEKICSRHTIKLIRGNNRIQDVIGGTRPPEMVRTKDSSWQWKRNRLIRRHVSNVAQSSSESGKTVEMFTRTRWFLHSRIRRKSTSKNLRGSRLNAEIAFSDTKMATGFI